MTTSHPAYICIPLKSHEAECLEQHGFQAYMGATYSGEQAPSHCWKFLTTSVGDLRELSRLLNNAANMTRLLMHPSPEQTGPQAPCFVLNHLRLQVDAADIGYRAGEIFDDAQKGGQWLHNETLAAFDHMTPYELVVRDGRVQAVRAYLESLAAGATG